MRIVLLISLFLFSSVLYAQEKSPTEKIDFHLKLSKEYRRNNPEKRIWHARKALFLAEKYNEKKARGKALGEIGSYFKSQSINDSAEVYYGKTLEQFKQINDRTNYAATLTRISSLAEKKGDLIKAIQLLTTADSLFKLENKSKHLVILQYQTYSVDKKNTKRPLFI